ncbi:MAG: glutamate--tRNA ligase [Thermoplasmata archaeon]
MTESSLSDRIRRLVLANALAHGGAARGGPILARLLATDPELRSRSSELAPLVAGRIREVSQLSPEQQATELANLGGPEPEGPRQGSGSSAELPELPGAVPGHVTLRLAPFPSGALHVGNARMLYLNDAYRRRYDGRLLLVFDDTIGSAEKRVDPELFEVILDDLRIAEVPVDAVYYKSDRIPRFYPWARRVIDAGGAYVCTCPAELLRENRRVGRPCPEREQPPEQTVDGWEGMLGGRYAEGEAVLRLRTDLADPDPAFRDRVLFRISELEHPRVGRKYRVWPLLEFSWAVDDLELGISHVLRGKDLVMEDRMEEHLWRLLGLTGPSFLHWGILRVREAKLSKSKSYQEVRSGAYDGWADPRTWSIRSLRRRGIRSEALRRFTLSFGMSLADIEVPAETLYAENRQLIDGTTPRRAFVPDPVAVEVESYPEDLGTVVLPNHPEREELGKREVRAGPIFWLPGVELARHAGEEIRLKDLVNVTLPAAVAPLGGTDPIRARFTSRENRRLPRIQWVGAEGSVEVDLLEVDGTHRRGRGESALTEAAPGSPFQFERVGFVRLDPEHPPGAGPVRACYGHP